MNTRPSDLSRRDTDGTFQLGAVGPAPPLRGAMLRLLRLPGYQLKRIENVLGVKKRLMRIKKTAEILRLDGKILVPIWPGDPLTLVEQVLVGLEHCKLCRDQLLCHS